MRILGIPFPYDRRRETSGHGVVLSFILRMHPLVFCVAAFLVGWYFAPPSGWLP